MSNSQHINNKAGTGLSGHALAQIRAVLSRYPKIDSAILYGSRAKGNYKTGSDIDPALVGEGLGLRQLAALQGRWMTFCCPICLIYLSFITSTTTRLSNISSVWVLSCIRLKLLSLERPQTPVHFRSMLNQMPLVLQR